MNGNEPLVILIGAIEDTSGAFDPALVNPISFPLAVPGVGKPFPNLDKYELQVTDMLAAHTDGYRGGLVTFSLETVGGSGAQIISITVQPSPGRPHQNSQDHRHYCRDGRKTRPMKAAELEAAFAAKSAISAAGAPPADPRLSRMWPNPGDELRSSGADQFDPKGVVVADPASASEGAGLVRLRLLPEQPLDPPRSPTQLRQLCQDLGGLSFHGYRDGDSARNEFGYGMWFYHPGLTKDDPRGAGTVTQVFTDGEIAGIDTRLLQRGTVPWGIFPQTMTDAYDRYRTRLSVALGCAPPYRWIASLEGVRGHRIAYGGFSFEQSEPFVTDNVTIEGLDDGTAGAKEVLKPFLDAVLDAGGIAVS
ncbi:MAG: hypothetical protein RLW87_20930 [Alphaproteobacteria bacterium]